MAEALTLDAADRRLAALAAAFLEAPEAALTRLAVPASAGLRAEAARLAAAPRRERLLELHLVCTAAAPSRAGLAGLLGAERGALLALLREASGARPNASARPLFRLCQERLLQPRSAP
ncbi:MAG TPA: hypothetical protein VFE30_14590 [Anaeromyxobacteraceae bacterium]|jgi:hypothetical protein|nr:hypothetical protein [Anaeromyxobacteraceae bacterium]